MAYPSYGRSIERKSYLKAKVTDELGLSRGYATKLFDKVLMIYQSMRRCINMVGVEYNTQG